ncbi:MAG: hypothetical protein WA821_05470 [Anaerolineales bacterium]
MDMPLLILNVQFFSLDMGACCLTSNEGILKYNEHIEINIPASTAISLNGGPFVGECYFIRYLDRIANDGYPTDFCYAGMVGNQFVFSSAVMQCA